MNKKRDNQIYVTMPTVPPLEEFIKSLEDIWESRWLTNIGKFHKEFEAIISPVTPSEILQCDVFDMFSHWLKAEKKYWQKRI